jgi:hypothetical protein
MIDCFNNSLAYINACRNIEKKFGTNYGIFNIVVTYSNPHNKTLEDNSNIYYRYVFYKDLIIDDTYQINLTRDIEYYTNMLLITHSIEKFIIIKFQDYISKIHIVFPFEFDKILYKHNRPSNQ